MKNIKFIVLFAVAMLSGCANRGQDPEPSYYGSSEYHCYAYNVLTLKVYEGVNSDEKLAMQSAFSRCEGVTPQQCHVDECVQK